MKITIPFLATLLLISCAGPGNNKNAISDLKSDSIKVDKNVNLASKDSFNINVSSIKERYHEYSTSTILNESVINGFHKYDNAGFFGSYILIDSITLEKHGSLIIYNKGIPSNWKYENTDDIFISLEYQKGDLEFFNDIHIGMESQELNSKISGKLTATKDSIIKATLGNYFVDFHMVKNRVARIKITRNDSK